MQELVDDLARHFQISRNTEQIGCILVNLLKTDFSFGLVVDSLNILRGNQDTVLANMAQTEVRKLNPHNTMFAVFSVYVGFHCCGVEICRGQGSK